MLHFSAVLRHRFETILLVSSLILFVTTLLAQDKIVWSDQEKPIVEQLHGLRKLDDTVRARTTRELALQIRQLPVAPNAPPHKLRLAGALAALSTEGDFGKDTLQEVTTTLATALREQPPAGKPGEPDSLYVELASLVRYEQMQATSDNPQFATAMAKLEADDAGTAGWSRSRSTCAPEVSSSECWRRQDCSRAGLQQSPGLNKEDAISGSSSRKTGS